MTILEQLAAHARQRVAADREAAARDCEAKRILARLGTLAKY